MEVAVGIPDRKHVLGLGLRVEAHAADRGGADRKGEARFVALIRKVPDLDRAIHSAEVHHTGPRWRPAPAREVRRRRRRGENGQRLLPNVERPVANTQQHARKECASFQAEHGSKGLRPAHELLQVLGLPVLLPPRGPVAVDQLALLRASVKVPYVRVAHRPLTVQHLATPHLGARILPRQLHAMDGLKLEVCLVLLKGGFRRVEVPY
mmetsp:Transcript_14999/g.37359  ORF Transcript_14999/g.37359 Transcript_14999/m.37359 type:complete len:208 (-) Transcript_14999:84-707(-)